jgi:3-dehydroquinate synthase
MTKKEFPFSEKAVAVYFNAAFTFLDSIIDRSASVIITDRNIFNLYQQKFTGWRTVVIPSGEEHKQQSTIDFIIQQLIELEADRNTFIVGIGGGVVTDIAGYAAGVYMRGLKFGFIPTTILAMVDAAIGGKNGVDAGIYKNLVGLIRQPEFLFYDYSFLETLPREEWVNGFAEIIKHACIKDEVLFEALESHSLDSYMKDKDLIAALVEKNAGIKFAVVLGDEFETGERKLLNFGHTYGHAIENVYHLPHGHAVSLGIVKALKISGEINNFSSTESKRVMDVLQKYSLPVNLQVDSQSVFSILKMDKKRSKNEINYILMDKIGKAVIRSISFTQLEKLIKENI